MQSQDEKTHRLEIRHHDIAGLCQEALTGNDDGFCKRYQELMTLMPNGLYRQYDGNLYLLLGVDRCRRHRSENYYYVARTLLLTGDSPTTICTWPLIGEDAAWFKPVRVGNKMLKRFTLMQRMDAVTVINRLRSKKKKKK